MKKKQKIIITLGLLSCYLIFTGFDSLPEKEKTGKPSIKSARLQKGIGWKVPELGMEFVWLKPLGIWVGKYEVTNGEYRKFNPKHDSKKYKGHTLNGDSQPVVFITFNDAVKYAEWLTKHELEAGRLPQGYKYRLPTRKEWKEACQCEQKWKFPWGKNWPPKSGEAGNYSDISSAWCRKMQDYDDGFPVTCPVEKSWANKWGVYGMGGNVWECTIDDEDKSLFKSWMGGSWYNCDENDMHPWTHIDNSSNYPNCTFGFRLILSPAEQ